MMMHIHYEMSYTYTTYMKLMSYTFYNLAIQLGRFADPFRGRYNKEVLTFLHY